MKNKTTFRSSFACALAAHILLLGALTLGGRLPVWAQAPAPVITPLPPNAPVPPDGPSASEINDFLAADKKQMPPAGAVLFIGSSSIRLWTTLGQDFPEIPVINRGFGGSLIENSTYYAQRIVIPYKPKIVVMYAGTNDLDYGNKTPEQVLEEYEAFVAEVHAALPDTRIVFISINPSVARWHEEAKELEANYLIEKFIIATNSPAEKLDFIDSHSQLLTADDQPQPDLLRTDGLHLNAAGYKVFVGIVKPRILALADLDNVARLQPLTER